MISQMKGSIKWPESIVEEITQKVQPKEINRYGKQRRGNKKKCRYHFKENIDNSRPF